MKKLLRTLALFALIAALVLSLSLQAFAARPPKEMVAQAFDPNNINITSDDTIPTTIQEEVSVTSWYQRDTLDEAAQAAFEAAREDLLSAVPDGSVARYFFNIDESAGSELTIDLPDEKVNAYSPITVTVMTPDGPVKMDYKAFNDDAITINFTAWGPVVISVGVLADNSTEVFIEEVEEEEAPSVHRGDAYEIVHTDGNGIVLTEYPDRYTLSENKRLYYEESFEFLPVSVPLDMSCCYFIHIDKGSSNTDPPFDINIDLTPEGIDLSSIVDVKLFKDGAWSHQPFFNNGDGTILCTFSDWGPVALYFEDGTVLTK